MPNTQQESVKQEVSLLEELTAAYQQSSAMKFAASELALLDALKSPNIEVSTKAAIQLHQLGDKLNQLVIKDGRFPGDSNRMVQGDGGASAFYPYCIGSQLVRRTLQTGSPKAAIEWAQKVLATTTANGKSIHALWGVPVGQEILLTSEVKIVPIEDLPESYQKQWITGRSYFPMESLVTSMLDLTPPKSALVMNRCIEPFTYDPAIQTNLPNDGFIKTDELLKDIALALTVVGPRVPITAAQWFTFDDPDLEQAGMMSGGRRGQMLEILPNRHSNYPMLCPTEAPQIVQAYLALHGKTRDKVRVALQRLNQAQRRHNVGDRAVELSTAFETLLGDDTTTEMTHKIKVRSVRLIGGADEVRKRNAAIINKAYSIRSTLVHTGHVDTARSESICGQRMSVSDIIDHTIIMCVDLIKIIIRRGSIPNWPIFDITEQT